MIVEIAAAAEADLERTNRVIVLHILNGAMDFEAPLFPDG
jgi:hypothetical protein